MNEFTRRGFLRQAGLAAMGTVGLVLRADAAPTPTSHDAEEAEKILIEMGPPPKATVAAPGDLKQTVSRELGPFYKTGAPFRAKVCPPRAEK